MSSLVVILALKLPLYVKGINNLTTQFTILSTTYILSIQYLEWAPKPILLYSLTLQASLCIVLINSVHTSPACYVFTIARAPILSSKHLTTTPAVTPMSAFPHHHLISPCSPPCISYYLPPRPTEPKLARLPVTHPHMPMTSLTLIYWFLTIIALYLTTPFL